MQTTTLILIAIALFVIVIVQVEILTSTESRLNTLTDEIQRLKNELKNKR